MSLAKCLIVACVAVVTQSALAAEAEVTDAWIRLLPGEVPAGGYFKIRNGTSTKLTLVGATSEAFGEVMIHRTVEEKGKRSMLHVDQVEVAAGRTLTFAPGGYHLMLINPTRKIAVGDRIPVAFEFSSGRRITMQFQVKGPGGG